MAERFERQPTAHEFRCAEDARYYQQLEPLAPALLSHEADAREQGTVILWPVIDKVARVRCGHLAHRGGRCRGELDPAIHAYGAIRDATIDQAFGAEGGPKPWIVDWLEDPGRCTVEQLLFGRMPDRDAGEAWKRELGLVQRPRGKGIDRLEGEVERSLRSAPIVVRRSVAALGFEAPDAATWLDALLLDAFQPAPDAIDAGRIRRYLGTEISGLSVEEVEDHIAVVAAFIDRCLFEVAPQAYDDYLVRPRSQARPPDSTRWAAELESQDSAAEDADDHVRATRLASGMLAAHERTDRSLRDLLADPAVTLPCGFEPDELAQLRTLEDHEIEAILRPVLAA